MPELDGYEATQRIRGADRERAATLIIAMTAGTMKGDEERARAPGSPTTCPSRSERIQLATVVQRWVDTSSAAAGNGAGARRRASIPRYSPGCASSPAGPELLGELVLMFLQEATTCVAELGTRQQLETQDGQRGEPQFTGQRGEAGREPDRRARRQPGGTGPHGGVDGARALVDALERELVCLRRALPAALPVS